MKPDGIKSLISRLREELAASPEHTTIGIVGITPTALRILEVLSSMRLSDMVSGIYAHQSEPWVGTVPVKPVEALRGDRPSILVVASDRDKEALLADAVPHLVPNTRILIGGFSHFDFRDPIFEDERGKTLIPSFANGYPNSLIHIYQCLQNAARLGLEGIVAEFGMFKGGTTMLMSRFIERLGQDWKVYGFDSFAGFPPPRSALDMYSHPDCVYLDERLLRQVFRDRNVEIVAGDIVDTVSAVQSEPIVLAFVDTDNFTPANAVLDAIQDQVVLGGAIIFDHFTGHDRFLYTLGERIAAKRLLDDRRYFNLHGTGVFLRQR